MSEKESKNFAIEHNFYFDEHWLLFLFLICKSIF